MFHVEHSQVELLTRVKMFHVEHFEVRLPKIRKAGFGAVAESGRALESHLMELSKNYAMFHVEHF